MPSPSSEAIGAVSELLSTRLSAALNNLPISIGRPDVAAGGQGGRTLNLFLYRVAFDPHLRNEPLDRGQPAPLWLTLHYLLTAFDSARESDSAAAHRLLGQGMAALQELNYVRAPALSLALAKNPEPLKLTFDDADVELLSKLMQGTDERYRISAALQVRPIMLRLETPPEHAPLVQTIGPIVPQPDGPPAPTGVIVTPSLGAVLDEVDPLRFTAGTAVTLRGADMQAYTEAFLGTTPFPLTAGPEEGTAAFTVPAASPLAANSYPLYIARTLPSGRKVTSNALLAQLQPVLANATLAGPLTVLPPGGPTAPRHGSFTLTGAQFGGSNESAFASLYLDGRTFGLFEPDAGGTSTQLTFTVPASKALPPAAYRVVLRVNGQQAVQSPVLNWA